MIERVATRNVARAAVCILRSGIFALAGCGGGSGGSPPLISTSITVSASPASVVSGATVTLAAAVEYAPAETASGTVDFADGGATIGSASLDPKGVGSLKIATLAVGSHSITAAYLGNSTTSASMSSAVTVTVKAKAASSLARSRPVNLAISNVPEAATFIGHATFALAVDPEGMGCTQLSSVVMEEEDQGNWRLYCRNADSFAAAEPQSYEVAVPNKDLLEVAMDPWFVDTSGQNYILLQAVPRTGHASEITP